MREACACEQDSPIPGGADNSEMAYIPRNKTTPYLERKLRDIQARSPLLSDKCVSTLFVSAT